MIEVKIKAVGMDINSMSPVVILSDLEEKNFLPIWIGLPEAQSIAMQIQQTPPPRPFTHDLMINILNELNISIKSVSIVDLKDGVYYATITLALDGKIHMIDSRPSDAIALAVRTDTPIYVDEKVAAEAFILSESVQQQDNQEEEEFRQFLNNLKLDDLDKYL
ncbi:MAG TPA: bifunctional nuclease family protein [bacterium]|nr:bifunctional nuclease family protein [bacterium]